MSFFGDLVGFGKDELRRVKEKAEREAQAARSAQQEAQREKQRAEEKAKNSERKAQAAREAEQEAQKVKVKAESEAKIARLEALTEIKEAKEKAEREAQQAHAEANAKAKAAQLQAEKDIKFAQEKANTEAEATKEKAEKETQAAKAKAAAEANAAKEKFEKETREAQEKAKLFQEENERLTARPVRLEEPFRVLPLDEEAVRNKYKDKVMTEKPCNREVESFRILLMGLVGHGKTSVVNTVYSAIKGKVVAPYTAGQAAKSVTKQLHELKLLNVREYRLETSNNKDMAKERTGHFVFSDTMGIESEDGIKEQDLVAILDGSVKANYMFNPTSPIRKTDPNYRENPGLKHKPHCVGVCVDANTLGLLDTNDKDLQKIERTRNVISEKGMPFIVLLTKIDQICPLVKEDPALTFYSPDVKDAVDKVAELFRIPSNQVYPVKNYASEVDPVVAVDTLMMYALNRMLEFADATLEANIMSASIEEESNILMTKPGIVAIVLVALIACALAFFLATNF